MAKGRPPCSASTTGFFLSAAAEKTARASASCLAGRPSVARSAFSPSLFQAAPSASTTTSARRTTSSTAAKLSPARFQNRTTCEPNSDPWFSFFGGAAAPNVWYSMRMRCVCPARNTNGADPRGGALPLARTQSGAIMFPMTVGAEKV